MVHRDVAHRDVTRDVTWASPRVNSEETLRRDTPKRHAEESRRESPQTDPGWATGPRDVTRSWQG